MVSSVPEMILFLNILPWNILEEVELIIYIKELYGSEPKNSAVIPSEKNCTG